MDHESPHKKHQPHEKGQKGQEPDIYSQNEFSQEASHLISVEDYCCAQGNPKKRQDEQEYSHMASMHSEKTGADGSRMEYSPGYGDLSKQKLFGRIRQYAFGYI
jgi:hypothetical protein